jgi:hypothetical protein
VIPSTTSGDKETTDAGTSEQASGTTALTTEGETSTASTGPVETTVTNQETTSITGVTGAPAGTTNQETEGTADAGSTVTDSPTSTTTQEPTGTAGTGITVTEETTTNTNEETSGAAGSTDLTTPTTDLAEETTSPLETTNTGTTNPTGETSGSSETTGVTEATSTGNTETTKIPEDESSTKNPDENAIATTEAATPEASGGGQCPSVGALDQDQFVVVCPTGFRRHPKHCDLFYQCTTSGHEMNILVLACTNGTFFDDNKIQCLPPQQAAPCEGGIAGGRFNRRVDKNSGSLPVSFIIEDPRFFKSCRAME